jgi:4-cresol dehydrogenase (hydroxylating) flavoprotein subunit
VIHNGTEKFLTDISGFVRNIEAVYRPTDVEELRDLFVPLYQRGVQLYVVSTGLNFGYGSALPVRQNSIIIGLERLDTIHQVVEVDDFAYAVIEPGVTQEALASYLSAHHENWFLNLTAASGQSSVVGNCLERGIGYFGLRSKDVLSFKVMRADGHLAWTTNPSPDEPGFPFVSGSDYTHTLLQSGGHIVVAMAIRLHRRRAHHAALSFEVSPKVTAISIAKAILGCPLSVTCGVTHIGNKHRSYALLERAINARRASAELPPQNKRQVHAYIESRLSSEWNGFTPVVGSAQDVAQAHAILTEALGSRASVAVVDRQTINHVRRSAKLLSFSETTALVNGHLDLSDALLSIVEGTPSNHFFDLVVHDFRKYGRGFFYFSPVLPSGEDEADEAIRLVDEIYRSAGLRPEITLNIVPIFGTIAVTSASYPLLDLALRDAALNCLDKLHELALREQWLIYRRDVNHMESARFTAPEIGNDPSLDPLGTIAKGRYGPLV